MYARVCVFVCMLISQDIKRIPCFWKLSFVLTLCLLRCVCHYVVVVSIVIVIAGVIVVIIVVV